MWVQRSIILISTLQSISYSVDGPWVTCKFICTHTQFNLILIKPFTSAKCAVRQRRDPGRGFLRAVCRTWRNDQKNVWLGFSGNFWNIKENLGSNFTLEVFIFRKTEHRQPIKICVHWGIPVSWHDNLLFKCTAAFLPYTTEQSRQLIHYHWAPFFLSLPPRFLHEPLLSALPDHCSCPTVKTLLCSAAEPANWTGQRATVQVRVSAQLFMRRWISRGQISGGVIGGE